MTLFEIIKSTAPTADQTMVEKIASQILDQFGENVTEEQAIEATKAIVVTDTSKGGTVNAFIDWLWYRGYTIIKAHTPNANFECYEATITDKSGYNTVTIFFGGETPKITARIDKINGTHRWYYGKTISQMMAVVRQCMEGYEFEGHTEDITTATKNEEEETMETKIIVTTTDTIPTTTNNEKEETTMKSTKINLATGEITFEQNGSTYTHTDGTNYYYRTTDGKKVRISKAEWTKAHDEHITAEQEKLDEKPSKVEVNSDLQKPAVFRKDNPDCVDCSHCNVTGCVHRDCMRRNPRSAGGLGECPRLDVKPIVIDEDVDEELEQIIDETGLEKADAELERNIRKEQKSKKASKPRRSKDIAYEANGLTLTAKQVDFIKHLPDTNFWEHGLESCIWVDVLCDEIGGQFEDKPMTVGAMISTLCEKGLGIRGKEKMNGRKATFFELTEMGMKVAGDLGLA